MSDIQRRHFACTPESGHHLVSGPDPNLITVTIPADKLSVTVILTPRFDGVEEGDEVALITLQDDDIYTLGKPLSQQISILDFRELMFKDGFE